MAPDKYQDFAALQTDIVHSSLLEELIFWTFKYEFPQNFVCFLLNMLPDPEYKVKKTIYRYYVVAKAQEQFLNFFFVPSFYSAGAINTNICNALQSNTKGA